MGALGGLAGRLGTDDTGCQGAELRYDGAPGTRALHPGCATSPELTNLMSHQPPAYPRSRTEDEPADGVDKALFFAIMGAFPSGVTIVTAIDADGAPRGLTSNATCSVSAEPPLLLVCVDKRSQTLGALRQSGGFVVNYLAAGRDELANRFASKEPDKFRGVVYRASAEGLPVLHEDAIAYAVCRTDQEVDAGDHLILIGRVLEGQAPAPGSAPLMYFRRGYATWPTSGSEARA